MDNVVCHFLLLGIYLVSCFSLGQTTEKPTDCVVSGIHIPPGTNRTLTNSSSFCVVYVCNQDGTGYSLDGFEEQCDGKKRTYPTYGPGCVVSGIVIPFGTKKTLHNSTSFCVVYVCNEDGTGKTIESWGGC